MSGADYNAKSCPLRVMSIAMIPRAVVYSNVVSNRLLWQAPREHGTDPNKDQDRKADKADAGNSFADSWIYLHDEFAYQGGFWAFMTDRIVDQFEKSVQMNRARLEAR